MKNQEDQPKDPIDEAAQKVEEAVTKAAEESGYEAQILDADEFFAWVEQVKCTNPQQ